jgi:hypothetical protein
MVEMRKILGGKRLLSCVMIFCLGVGCMSGCERFSSEDASSQEAVASETPLPEIYVSHNEDTHSNLGAWARAMGSVLIALNDGNPYYFGGYEATDANRDAAAQILKTSWNISSRKDLKKQIRNLLKTGSRKEYLQEAKELKSLSAKERKKALKQLSGDLALHYENLQYNWKTWGKKGLLAWDLCRISHLVQWGYIAGYLDREEAQSMIEPAAKKLQKNFNNWEDVVKNWLDGYRLAASIPLESVEETDYDKRWNIYLSLVEGQEEKGVLYDDTLFTTEIIPLSSDSEETTE